MMQKVMCQKTARHAGRLLSKFKMAAAIILDFTKFAAISLLLIGFSPNFSGVYFILWPRNVIRQIVDY
jgi:hypothetical protein